MKFILPLLISVFITGCTLTDINKPSKIKQEPTKENKESKVLKKNHDQVFSTKYDAKQEHVYSNLNNTIIDIADQLFHTKTNKKSPTRVILTTFVDLNKLEKTSTFGRLISESMFNELHIRKFEITDFRGRSTVSVNEDGEFHITRDVEELKDNVEAVEYILVGTYVKFEDQSLLINARILDSISGKILSSARVVYRPRDCALFDICKESLSTHNLFDGTEEQSNSKQVMNMNTRENSNFTIISDDCKGDECDK